jgi:hypothetical protein
MKNSFMQKYYSAKKTIGVGSFVSHIIYGIVLGVVSSAIMRKPKKAYNFDSLEEILDEGK